MSPSRLNLLALGTLLLACSAFVGCEDSSSMTNLPSSAGGFSRIISLDGAEYLLNPKGAARVSDRCAGVHPIGDIDGDGQPDIVVALNRKGASAPSEHTWIEAYSGRGGGRLWSLQGHYNRDPKKGYTLGPIAVVGDVDGDAVADVYCLEAYHRRSAFVISGREGNILAWYALERKPEFELPIRCQDFNGDGVADLFFSRCEGRPLGLTILSGKDLAELTKKESLWPEAGDARIEWVLRIYHDENGDKIDDCLVRRMLPKKGESAKEIYQYAVLDGKDFSLLRTFKSPRPRVTAKTYFAAIDDLDGDGVGDFVFSSAAGSGTKGRQSLLRAVSGANGAVIWDVGGDRIGVGDQSWSVDVKTGKKESLAPDVGLGNHLVIVPDFDGDGIEDIAALTDAGSSDGKRPAVLIVSGKAGKIITSLTPIDRECRLQRGGQIVRLPGSRTDKMTTIVVSARSLAGDAVLAIFDCTESPQ